MKFDAPIEIKAEVKSPVFVWDGDTIKPLSFVIEGNQVHVIDPDRFLAALNDQERQSYLNWIEPILDALSDLDDKIQNARQSRNEDLRRQLNQQRRNKVTELSLERFLSQRLGNKNPAAFVRQTSCIAYSVGYAVRPTDDGFRGFIKGAGWRPFVPGTEIKGALRTSLLYALLGEQQRYQFLKNEVAQFERVLNSEASPKKKESQLKKIADRLEADVFRPGDEKGDAKYDFLRSVQVTDGSLLATSNMRVRSLESAGTERFTKVLAEGLESGTFFVFRLALASATPDWAWRHLGLSGLAQSLSIDHLFRACYERSDAILKTEAMYFASNQNIRQQIESLQSLNRPDAPLLRLGTGQGFLSVTVDLRVRERDAGLYEAIREGVSEQRRWRTLPNKFPKTRRTVSDGNRHPLMLTGWIKLVRKS